MTTDAPGGSRSGQDQERIEAYLLGEPETFREIDGWIRAEVLSSYHSLREDHEDVCQVVHEKVLTNLRSGQYQGRSSLRSYISGIVHHTAIDRLRGRYRDRLLVQADDHEPEDDSQDPYRALEIVEERSLLHRAIHLSPASCKRLWQMVFVERLSYEAIGERLSVPPGTVKSRSWHCRKKALAVLKRLRLQAGPRSPGPRPVPPGGPGKTEP